MTTPFFLKVSDDGTTRFPDEIWAEFGCPTVREVVVVVGEGELRVYPLHARNVDEQDAIPRLIGLSEDLDVEIEIAIALAMREKYGWMMEGRESESPE